MKWAIAPGVIDAAFKVRRGVYKDDPTTWGQVYLKVLYYDWQNRRRPEYDRW